MRVVGGQVLVLVSAVLDGYSRLPLCGKVVPVNTSLYSLSKYSFVNGDGCFFPLEDLGMAATGQFNFNKFSSRAVVFPIITGPGTSTTSNVICFGSQLWGP